MSNSVFVVSEWLAKPGFESKLEGGLREIICNTRQEPGCIRAHITKQIKHPGSPGKSKLQIVLLQEYKNIEAFNLYCPQLS